MWPPKTFHTYQARLNCSLPGKSPFYFNEIQSVYKLPEYFDDQKFYAVFTTNPSGPISSAVCAYDIADIEAVFNGEFKEQTDPDTPWKIVPNSDVPTPRPGSWVEDSKSLSNSHVKFILTHPLMHQEVKPAGGSPIYYTEGAEFTHIILDKVSKLLIINAS